MASTPYFFVGPSALLSLVGLTKGPDETEPTPPEDWRQAKVDVVIPALDEEDHIIRCLASVMRQTFQPRQIILVDDGSTDQTVARAEAFCKQCSVKLIVIRRREPIGKTPTIKRQAREFDSDVEFILDGDTVLESHDYIARTVEELYKAIGIASACGTILPLRRRDRRTFDGAAAIRRFYQAHPDASPRSRTRGKELLAGVTNLYREVLYLFLQKLVYRGQMVCFGTIGNPVGCAVAYRRKYVKKMFDYFTPQLGDDLTNSEDIFIGLAMLNEGYRNIQLTDVYARTVEPEIHRLPRQLYLWCSSFLQSCWYFDPLMRSPFKVLKRAMTRRRPPSHPRGPSPESARLAGLKVAGATPGDHSMPLHSVVLRETVAPSAGPAGAPPPSSRSAVNRGDRRIVREPYRQPFGRQRTEEYGRPAGWILLAGATEKISFPIAMLLMAAFRAWEPLALTVALDTLFCVGTLAWVMKGRRLEYIAKGLVVTPIRYASLAVDLATLARFSWDLWVTGNRRWRK